MSSTVGAAVVGAAVGIGVVGAAVVGAAVGTAVVGVAVVGAAVDGATVEGAAVVGAAVVGANVVGGGGAVGTDVGDDVTTVVGMGVVVGLHLLAASSEPSVQSSIPSQNHDSRMHWFPVAHAMKPARHKDRDVVATSGVVVAGACDKNDFENHAETRYNDDHENNIKNQKRGMMDAQAYVKEKSTFSLYL